jgi:hypothetical protein
LLTMRIALITEGISEYRVLKHLLRKYFKGYDPEINQIQPKVIGEKQDGIGGWAKVLEYCSRKDIRDILIENEYLVIQIDTDNSPIAPFDVPHTHDSLKKTEFELCSAVEAKLKALIDPAIYKAYSNRILFAVSVHTTECWLLTIFQKSATNNCLHTLNDILIQKKMPKIQSAKNSPNSRIAYETVLQAWGKRKDITVCATRNASLKHFVDQLAALDPEFSI